VEKRALSQDFS